MNLVIVTGMPMEADTLPRSNSTIVLTGDPGLAELNTLDPRKVDAVISWGICGGLSPSVNIGDVFVSTRIIVDAASGYAPVSVDTEWADVIWFDTIAPATGATYSSSKLIATDPAARAALCKATGADTVDQLSYAVAAWATQNKRCYVNIGAVSDSWNQAITTDPKLVNANGSPSAWEALNDLIKQSSNLPLMVKEAWTTQAALHALSVAAWKLHRSGWCMH